MKVRLIDCGTRPLEAIRRALALALCASLLGSLPASFATAEEYAGDPNEVVDLEDLIFMEVTSVSKRAQKLTESPAAIYVVTQEDIRRTGVTSIPEALRQVPGLEVASITSTSYAISSRGLNGMFSDKLLVLIDGRSVYTPTFGGVFWDVQDTMMEDIDRIEVIRGPGATLWGANAVNGVINIITKTADDTQGGVLVAGAGSHERAFSSLRYGGEMGGDKGHYRVYGKFKKREAFELADGSDGPDDSTEGRVGFRTDFRPSDRDLITVQGDLYKGEMGLGYEGLTAMDQPTEQWDDAWDLQGGNVLARWGHTFSEANALSLQSYFDRTERESVALGIERNTFDVDFQHLYGWNAKNDLTWGLGFRVTSDEIENRVSLYFDPDSRTDYLYTGFVQNETRFVDDRLHFVIGTKLEHNDYTGFEIQPSVRSIFLISDRQSVWGSVSRALQTGSRIENLRMTEMVFAADDPDNPAGFLPAQLNGQVVGSEDKQSQEVIAYELGYRLNPLDNLNFDLAGFYNEYQNLSSVEPVDESNPIPWPDEDDFFGATAIIVRGDLGDNIEGHSYGAELAAQWQVFPEWRLAGGYTYLKIDMDEDKSIGGVGEEEDGSPVHQVNARSLVDLPMNLQWDTMVYWVDEASAFDADSYTRLDMRLGWKPMPNLDLSLIGQNLTQSQHKEWEGRYGFQNTEVPRSFYAKVTWEF